MERWRKGFCQALNRESRIERQPLVSAHPLQLTPAQVGQIAHIALCPTEWTFFLKFHLDEIYLLQPQKEKVLSKQTLKSTSRFKDIAKF